MNAAYEPMLLKFALMVNAVALGFLPPNLSFLSKNNHSAAPPNFLNAFGST